jgi:hypothetical protein
MGRGWWLLGLFPVALGCPLDDATENVDGGAGNTNGGPRIFIGDGGLGEGCAKNSDCGPGLACFVMYGGSSGDQGECTRLVPDAGACYGCDCLEDIDNLCPPASGSGGSSIDSEGGLVSPPKGRLCNADDQRYVCIIPS